MADLKISQLNPATTPLAGTEVLPIVQSGSTVKVSVANLTAGRSTSVSELKIVTANGQTNFVAGNTTGGNKIQAWNAAGNNDGYLALEGFNIAYGQFTNVGNWKPVAAKGIDYSANTPAAGMTSQLLNWYEEGTWTPVDSSGAGLSFTNASGYYTRSGNIVTLFGRVTFPATASVAAVAIGGLPFTVANNNQPGGGCIRITNSGRNDTVVASAASTTITFYSTLLVNATNANYSGSRVDWVVTYMV
jgi:hypothetical protein